MYLPVHTGHGGGVEPHVELYVQTDESLGLQPPQLYVGAGLVESEGVASTGSQPTGGKNQIFSPGSFLVIDNNK